MSNSKHNHLEGSRYIHSEDQNEDSPSKTPNQAGISWSEEIRNRARQALNKQKLKLNSNASPSGAAHLLSGLPGTLTTTNN